LIIVIYETVFVKCAKIRFMGVTIRKIARDLNLAVSTVSKALRDSHEISAETKARVFEYAAKMNYSPNPYASSLKRRRTENIAVIVPEVSDTFFSAAINGIEDVAHEMGYHVMIYLTHEDIGEEESILRDLRNGRVDGILISVAAGKTGWDYFSQVELPLIFFDRVREDVPATQIVTNDFEAGYNAVMHLISRGCTRIAFLAPHGELAIIRHRENGFRKAVIDSGLSLDACPVIQCLSDESANITMLTERLMDADHPDGLIGSVEKVTMQAYTVCHKINLSIPTDIKVIGFSHLQIAALLNPPLTTVTQPAYEMGKAAATALFKALTKNKGIIQPERIEIPSVLVERASTQYR
jgi:LacI family transcriptional regulator